MKTRVPKKKIFIRITCILIVILLVTLGLFTFYHPAFKQPTKQEAKLHTIVNKERINGYNFVDLANEFLFIGRHAKVALATPKGVLLTDIKFDASSVPLNSEANKNVVLYNEAEGKYEVYDALGEIILTKSNPVTLIHDSLTNKDYYLDIDGLYDLDSKLIYKDSEVSDVYGKYVFTLRGNLYNIDTKKTIKGNSYQHIGKYIIIEEGEKAHLYNTDKNEMSEYTIETSSDSGYILKSETDKYMLSANGRLTKVEKIKILDYILDYTACKIGFKIYQKEQLSDQCFYDYEQLDTSNTIILNSIDANYLLVKDKQTKFDGFYSIQGNFIVENLIQNTIIYNKEGQKTSSTCSSNLTYVGNNTYICSDSIHTYLVDENLQKNSEYYDEIICHENGYCTVTKNRTYGLIYKGKEIISPSKQNIKVYENMIILQDAFGFDILTLDEENDNILDLSELKTDTSILYERLDINKIIADYNLEDMNDLIHKNEDFFKKYAYIVENNPELVEYKEQVMRIFKLVAENKAYLAEDYFLDSLANLSISITDQLNNGATAGQYVDTTKEITLADKSKRVIYHELTHFVDFSISPTVGEGVYKYNDKYINYEEYKNLPFEEKNNVEYLDTGLKSFLTEGGAEVNSGIYLLNKGMTVYDTPVKVYNALSYIFGFDTMNDIFFSKDSDYKLFALLNKHGLNEEEIKILGYNSDPYLNNDTNTFELVDTLINLYEEKTQKKWLDDYEFKIIISHIIAFRKIEKTNPRYEELSGLDYDFRKFYDEKLGLSGMNIYMVPCFYVKDSDGSYFSLIIYEEGENQSYLTIQYDFLNDKVINTTKIPA